MDFLSKLDESVDKNNSLLCVGLDPDIDKLPAHLRHDATPLFTFNKAIIDATADLACAFKPNSAFYEAYAAAGIEQLQLTCAYIQEKYPHLPIVLDYKRGDIGNTNTYYARFAFESLDVDAITVHPYFGREANEAFLAYKDKGIIMLCKSSNPGSDEFQNLELAGKKLYVHVTERIKNEWNTNGNCHVMIGATYPKELAEARQIIGEEMIILIPGIGAQGGDVEATVKAGINQVGKGVMISSSRDILYASSGNDFAEAARGRAQATRDEINKYRGV
jgi:orotidine-5'-phosphate decarboxylase